MLDAVVAGRDAGTDGEEELCAVLLVDPQSPLAASGRVALVKACRRHGVPDHLIPSRVASAPDSDQAVSDEKSLRSLLLELCGSRRRDVMREGGTI